MGDGSDLLKASAPPDYELGSQSNAKACRVARCCRGPEVAICVGADEHVVRDNVTATPGQPRGLWVIRSNGRGIDRRRPKTALMQMRYRRASV